MLWLEYMQKLVKSSKKMVLALLKAVLEQMKMLDLPEEKNFLSKLRIRETCPLPRYCTGTDWLHSKCEF